MRLLLDESADARLVPYLRELGHDVTAIAMDHPASLRDHDVLAIAQREGRILITDDRDFGELVFHQPQPHAGVIYVRLGAYAPLPILQARLQAVLTGYADQLDRFLVVTHGDVRVRQHPANPRP